MTQRQEELTAGAPPGVIEFKPKHGFAQDVSRFFRTKPLGTVGAAIAVILILTAVYVKFIEPSVGLIADPYKPIVDRINVAPGGDAWFGGDKIGRDVFARLVNGAWISLYVGILSSFIGTTIGMGVGIASAYWGGKLDLIVQRLIDAMIAFPGIILAIAIMAALGASINNVVFALSVAYIPSAARIIRAQALGIKEMDYMLAARAVGVGNVRTMVKYIVPNVIAIYIVITTFHLGGAIIAEASLSFLGVGTPPNEPSWGGMLSGAASQYIAVAWWSPLFPGAAIITVVFAWNILGDALRDVLDPRLRGTRSAIYRG
jgi:peptide/nickel transport system permease protein